MDKKQLADEAAATLRRAMEARGREKNVLQEEALRLHRLSTATPVSEPDDPRPRAVRLAMVPSRPHLAGRST